MGIRHQKEGEPSPTLKQWADMLKERKLISIAVPLLDVLKVWGFVGGQVLWMLTPFLGQNIVAPLAQTLEDPEALQELQHYLIEESIAEVEV